MINNISETEKQQAKESLQQVIALADEFKPELVALVNRYVDLIIGCNAVRASVLQQDAKDILCALAPLNKSLTEEELVDRAVMMAKLLEAKCK